MNRRDQPEDFRVEHDSMGSLQVPAGALWGAQTQRAIQNFSLSGLTLPPEFIGALALIKWAAAGANRQLDLLDASRAGAIQKAALAIAAGEHGSQFPLDVFQTGSGTSSNMNVNEVIAHLASDDALKVHANDHVNMSQSSNDVVPAAIHLSAILAIESQLLPALQTLADAIALKAEECGHHVLTGRTHLMDAMPITLAQALSGWQTQIEDGVARLRAVQPRLQQLPLGGTAVGTGINAHPEFGGHATALLAERLRLSFQVSENYFAAISSQDTAVELSGALKTIAVSLTKIANDLRWMNSGPLAGLSEIELLALQPGSSIMPGKVNPVIPEAVAMIAAQVVGNDATITLAGQSGNFQLNVMLPIVAYNLLQSIQLLANACKALATRAIAGFKVNGEQIAAATQRNPVLVTALNPIIGYERAAAIAKRAYQEKRPIVEVAAEMTDISREELQRLLDPAVLTRGGIQGRVAGGG